MGYFLAVADQLHFGNAARMLHIAQPALSQQIRQLEKDLGLALFERTTRRVSLTPEGQSLVPLARRITTLADDILGVAAELRSGKRGVLRLGFVDSTAYDLVPRFLSHFRTLHPDVRIELHTLSSDEQAAAVADGQIDLGVARTIAAHGEVTGTTLGRDALMVAVPEGHALADEAVVDLRELAGVSFVGFDRNRSPTLHAELVALLSSYDLVYSPEIEATEYTTILGLVSAGVGVALVPDGVSTLRLPGLRYVPIANPDASVSLLVLTRVDNPRDLVRIAVDELREVAEASRIRRS
jgi:DNA-binding transcriptional LysR family regulator